MLCDVHHHHPHHGIHHLPPQDFYIQPFLIADYEVAADNGDEAAVLAQDEALIEKREALIAQEEKSKK